MEQDHESVPDSAEAPVDTFDKGRMAEEIVSGNQKRDHYGNQIHSPPLVVMWSMALTERITVEKTVHIGVWPQKGEKHKHQNHYPVRGPVADIGAYNG